MIALGLAAFFLSASSGCNVISATAYFLMGQESTLPPELKRLADNDRNKEVKVAIVTLTRTALRPELAGAEKELTNRLAQHLQNLCTANKEKVTVLAPHIVEQFRREHPSTDFKEMGKKLGVDYLIVLEIGSMSLYKEGSSDMLYQGKANITVRLLQPSKPDELADLKKEFSGQYPSEFRGGVLQVDENNRAAFLDAFYNSLAERLSWYFTAHSTASHFRCD